MKIGVTETYDPSFDIESWINRVDEFDVIYLITKNLTDELIYELTEGRLVNKKIILHLTCTGLSGTLYEPNTPSINHQFVNYHKLIQNGFLSELVVLRLDPIIPTKLGIVKAVEVLKLFDQSPIKRVRVSVLDMYPHVKDRLIELANNNPEYKQEINELFCVYHGFHCDKSIMSHIDKLLEAFSRYKFESCAEPYLKVPIESGCVNSSDLKLLNCELSDITYGHPRNGCLCLAKSQLIPGGFSRGRCPNKCIYCYIKDR